MIPAALSDFAARRRFAELLARCAVEQGKTGGLTSDEADEVAALAERLGVKLVWRWYDLTKHEWNEGRHDAN